MLSRIHIPVPTGGSAGETVLYLAIAVALVFLSVLIRSWLRRNEAQGGKASGFLLGAAFLIGGLIAAYLAVDETSANYAARYTIYAGGAILVGSLIFVFSDFALPAVAACLFTGIGFLLKPLLRPIRYPLPLDYAEDKHLFFVGVGGGLVLLLVALLLIKRRRAQNG
ncbi:MAG: hypothetical protein KC609_00990 [Myxococcales bacterium]|nr:hypothetical protein [Myxococcales bacterium]